MGMFWITEQCPPGNFSILLVWIRHCASSTDGEMKISREMQSHSRLGGSDAHDFVPTIPGCVFALALSWSWWEGTTLSSVFLAEVAFKSP